ncbi:Pycsar system effector family protein [Nocardia seriolae]|uniref:Pycsar effector protein domain-containing protein n=1 Tax=Nocardia seriolae TaxID=37332 RepID=A0A0B8NE00_9NOCA|nr:Pycsar system effector family protein [Nocardia seriolae]APB01388.1 hypothetical protein NS506_07368 [Nocardia seriolae]MTJ61122.1 hypothetical protein [Nocardia seriolae]MTJ75559.1 hypothetical protein [Nocardia seriolae]MTJ90751.1 hypothetical protein [Nocardia seriolae]MTK34710.1 hypothetical protein [Nocardia seriolae]
MDDKDRIAMAWQIHSAIMDWIGKVDVKASFTLTLDVALLAGVVTLSKEGGLLSGLTGSTLWLYRVGWMLLFLSGVCAICVVYPRIWRFRLKHEAELDGNFIFFGHLKSLSEAQVKEKLIRADTDKCLTALANQLARVSRIAWRRYRWAQRSLALVGLGSALLLASFLSTYTHDWRG